MAFAILIFSLLLSGCSSGTEERLLQRQTDLSSGVMRFHACVSTLTEGALWEFAGDVRAGGEEGELTLTDPEEIAGVRVSWGERMELSYDGAVLVLPTLGEEQSPVSSLPLLCAVLQRGWLLRYSESGERVTAVYGLDGGEELWVYYDSALVPTAAELYVDSRRCLWMEITNFTLETE